jgi:hypothetical protein
LIWIENSGCTQIETVTDYSFSKRIVASFITLQDGCHKGHHVLLNVLLLHGIDVLYALLNDACNLLAGESVHEHHPFVNQKLFGLVLYFYGFEHLNRFDDMREHFPAQIRFVLLNK